MPSEDWEQLESYADAITIDMVPDGYRLVSRQGVPLVGIGPLQLFVEPGSQQPLARCAVWYGAAAWAEWQYRGGTAWL